MATLISQARSLVLIKPIKRTELASCDMPIYTAGTLLARWTDFSAELAQPSLYTETPGQPDINTETIL